MGGRTEVVVAGSAPLDPWEVIPAARADLLCRNHELTSLERLVDEAAARSGAVAVLLGPAGIGKTTLLAELARRTAARGFRTLTAVASELERDLALGVAAQLFEPELSRADPDHLDRLLAGPARLAGALLGVPSGAHGSNRYPEPARPSTTEPTSPFASAHALYWLTANLADERPLLMTIDDVHWADEPTLRFLAFLAKRLDGVPALVAVAARPDEQAEPDPVLSAVLGAGTALHPQPLDESGVAELLTRELGSVPSTGFVQACMAATGGNPFLLDELCALARQEHIAPTDAEAGRIGGMGPPAISRSVLPRTGVLGADAVAFARALAILGEGARLVDTAELAGLSNDRAAACADALAAAGVLAPDPPPRFRHPIVANAVREDIALTERSRLHADAARLEERRDAPAQRIAAHLIAAGPRGDEWAVTQLRAAATEALGRGSPQTARTLLTRAVDEVPSAASRPDLLFDLGRAEARLGHTAAVGHLQAALDGATAPDLQVAIALELAAALGYSGQAAAGARVLVGTMAGIEDSTLARRLEEHAFVLAVTTTTARREVGGRLRVALALTRDDPDGMSRRVLAPLATELAAGAGSADQARQAAARALASRDLRPEELHDVSLIAMACGALAWAGAPSEADRILGPTIDRVRDHASLVGVAVAVAARAHIRARAGLLRDAESDARTVLDLEEETGRVWPVFAMLAGSALLTALTQQGDLEDATALADRLAGIPHDPRALLTLPLRQARAELHLARGDAAAALEEAADCERAEGVREGPLVEPVNWRSLAARANHVLGRGGDAMGLAQRGVELARSFGSRRTIGVALRCLAAVSDDPVPALEEACSELRQTEDVLELALALVDLGAALRRGGRKADAREPLNEGLAYARTIGASAVAERAFEELRASGSNPRKILRTGLDELTASELRVARLAAEGRSNRDIAGHLYITEKTVEAHLSHTYTKLTIGSRRELAAALNPRKP